MDWSKLISEFLHGKTEAIQAIFTIAGFIVGVIGTIYVAITFRQQAKINRQQYNLNRIAGEKHRRAIRPAFQAKYAVRGIDTMGYELKLANAVALNVKFFEDDQESNLISSHNAWETSDEPVFYPMNIKEEPSDTETVRKITFMDEDETEYIQLIKRKSNSFYTTFPKLRGNKS